MILWIWSISELPPGKMCMHTSAELSLGSLTDKINRVKENIWFIK